MTRIDRSRRRVLMAAAAWSCGAAGIAHAHDPIGLVSPAPATPPIELMSIDGRPTRLDTLLRGKVTALQLMFTGCSATCPISGALFADLQNRLAKAPSSLQLLSVSIDPLGDDPKSMRTWLNRFGARSDRWTAALSTTRDLDRLLDFVDGRRAGVDPHTSQVILFDAQARLSYRTAPLPPPAALEALMTQLAARA
jgi:protein SCO1/2